MVIDPNDVHPLTDFQRNAKSFLRRLRKSGRPEMLTVNGKAAVVVQDAGAFSAMLDRLESAYVVEAVRAGLEQIEAGKTVPLEQVAREIRAKYQQTRRRRSA